MTKESITLKRSEIRKIFARHRGAARRLAEELDLNETSVHHWLHSRFHSARILKAALRRAHELLELEKQNAA